MHTCSQLTEFGHLVICLLTLPWGRGLCWRNTFKWPLLDWTCKASGTVPGKSVIGHLLAWQRPCLRILLGCGNQILVRREQGTFAWEPRDLLGGEGLRFWCLLFWGSVFLLQGNGPDREKRSREDPRKLWKEIYPKDEGIWTKEWFLAHFLVRAGNLALGKYSSVYVCVVKVVKRGGGVYQLRNYNIGTQEHGSIRWSRQSLILVKETSFFSIFYPEKLQSWTASLHCTAVYTAVAVGKETGLFQMPSFLHNIVCLDIEPANSVPKCHTLQNWQDVNWCSASWKSVLFKNKRRHFLSIQPCLLWMLGSQTCIPCPTTYQ